MGRIVVTEFVSVDGVMEAPGPDGSGFKHEGWTFNISTGQEGEKFKLDETMESEAQLLGRVTYQGFASAWPSVKDEFGGKFNSMPKYVVSSTLQKAEWTNSTVLRGDVVDEVAKLKQRIHGDIVVHGSAKLVQTLLANDLVDELRLMVYPVILGSGKRLFGDNADLKSLRLKDSRTVGDGVLILTYERADEPATKA
jgi:dihydrofolate reductase